MLRAEHTRKLLDGIRDDWTLLEPLMVEVGYIIPPGKALRKYNSRGHQSSTDLSESEMIRSGARVYVRDGVLTLKKHGYIEVKREDGKEYARRLDPSRPAAKTTAPLPANVLLLSDHQRSPSHRHRDRSQRVKKSRKPSPTFLASLRSSVSE